METCKKLSHCKLNMISASQSSCWKHICTTFLCSWSNELMTSPVETEADRVCSMPGWESVCMCANSAWYGSVREADLRSGLRWGEEDSVTLADGVSTARCLTLGGMQRRDRRTTGLGTDLSSNSRGGEASDSELMGNNWWTDAGGVKRGEMKRSTLTSLLYSYMYTWRWASVEAVWGCGGILLHLIYRKERKSEKVTDFAERNVKLVMTTGEAECENMERENKRS